MYTECICRRNVYDKYMINLIDKIKTIFQMYSFVTAHFNQITHFGQNG